MGARGTSPPAGVDEAHGFEPMGLDKNHAANTVTRYGQQGQELALHMVFTLKFEVRISLPLILWREEVKVYYDFKDKTVWPHLPVQLPYGGYGKGK